jgi:RimJ/RimL family protein N-acetyltransferase
MFVHFDAKFGTCEVGCWLEPAARGRGLITRSVRLLIDWAMDVRGIYRVEWQCRPDNVASANIARRLGMHLDGVLRGEFPHHGVRHDTQVWSLIAPDRAGLRER